jgi:hypothetical protein
MDFALVMIRPNSLSSKDRLLLVCCVRRHREAHGITRRAKAILLLGKSKICAEIAEFLYLDDDRILGWFRGGRAHRSNNGTENNGQRCAGARKFEFDARARQTD